jgi:hypothetical protein
MPGQGSVHVEAEGFEPLERTFVVTRGEPATIELQLSPAAPPAQLRGLVRSFGGIGLKANIVVEPLGTSLTTDDQGFFSVDVPPGSYEVVITADGYQEQRRKVEVEEEGVTILNADLRKATR